MEEILTIIGNGFDLGHCLPTTFEKFIKSNSIFEKKYEVFRTSKNNWNEVENKYCELLCNKICSRKHVDISEIVDDIINNYGFDKYGNIDYYNYKSDLFNEEYEQIESLIMLLSDFENDFQIYLNKFCNSDTIKNCNYYEPVYEVLKSSTEIISFNYTKTIEILYKIKDIQHIHGILDDKIAIGTNSLDKAKESVISTEYPSINNFEKSKWGLQDLMCYYENDMENNLVKNQIIKSFFDQIVLENIKKENELFNLLDKKSKDSLIERNCIKDQLRNKKFEKVYIIGHSLGDADYSVLNAINKDAKIIYFYHSEHDIKIREKAMQALRWNYSLEEDTKLFKS